MPDQTIGIIGVNKEGRPIQKNSKRLSKRWSGGRESVLYSTERTITIRHPKLNKNKWTNVPTMYAGRHIPHSSAIRMAIEAKGHDPQTGRKLLGYPSIREAETAARRRSNSDLLKRK